MKPGCLLDLHLHKISSAVALRQRKSLRLFPFRVSRLAEWCLDPKAPLPLFHSFSCLFEHKPRLQQEISLCSLSLQIVHFGFLFALHALFPCRSALRVIPNYHTTESVLGCRRITSVREIGPNIFSLASGRVLGQGKKIALFFPKIPGE